VPNGKASTKVLLKDALHAPDLCLTVVSIGCIIKARYAVKFIDDHCNIKRGPDGPIIGWIPATQNRLFRTEHMFAAADLILAEPMDILTLHRRLGHISVDAICYALVWGCFSRIARQCFPCCVCPKDSDRMRKSRRARNRKWTVQAVRGLLGETWTKAQVASCQIRQASGPVGPDTRCEL
jgi:hypothetical protein